MGGELELYAKKYSRAAGQGVRRRAGDTQRPGGVWLHCEPEAGRPSLLNKTDAVCFDIF